MRQMYRSFSYVMIIIFIMNIFLISPYENDLQPSPTLEINNDKTMGERLTNELNSSIHDEPPPTSSQIRGIDPDQWFEGETVNITLESNVKYFPDQFHLIASDISDTIVDWDLWNMMWLGEDDGSGLTYCWNLDFLDNPVDDDCYEYVWMRIDTNGLNGKLYYDFKVGVLDGVTLSYDSTPQKGSFDITPANHLWNGDRLQIELQIFVASPNIIGRIMVVSNGGGGSTIADTSVYDFSGKTPEEWTLQFDYLYFLSDPIVSQYRSEYRYPDYNNPSLIEHKLEIDSPDVQTNITLELPNNFGNNSDSISITPSCSIEYGTTTNTITLYNTLPVTYDIRILEDYNQKTIDPVYPQYMALREVTNNYMENPSFEEGWSSDWEESSGFEFDTVDVDSSIVAKGVYSWSLTDDGSQGQIHNKPSELDVGYYYVSFWIYSFGNTLDADLDYYDGSSWSVLKQLDSYDGGRWFRVFVYVHIGGKDSTQGNLRFTVNNASNTVYIDGFYIGKVSTIVKTTGYSETTFTTNFICWDGYQNPSLTYHTIYWNLRDRTSDTSIDTYSSITNENGESSWVWKGRLDLEEYSLCVYSLNSFWGVSQSDQDEWCESISYFASNADNESESLSSDNKFGVYNYKVANNDTDSNFYITMYETAFDISNTFILTMWLKSNESSTIGITQMRSGSDYLSNTTDFEISTSWSRMSYVWRDSDTDDWDETTFSQFRIQILESTTIIEIDGARLIQAQELYFTSSPCSSVDYFDSDKLDFSEGDEEGISSGDTTSVRNGYLNLTSVDGTAAFTKGSLSIDANYYTEILLRAKANESCTLSFEESGSDQVVTFSLTTSWQLFTSELSSNWGGTETQIEVSISNTNIQVFIDLLEIVHQDSSLDSSSYQWEFKEEGYEEGFIASGGASSTIDVLNGYIEHSMTGGGYTYSGFYVDVEGLDLGNYDYLQVQVKPLGENMRILVKEGAGWNQITGIGTDSSNYPITADVWNDVLFTISDSSVTTRLLFFTYEDSSGGNLDGDETTLWRFIRFMKGSPPSDSLFETKESHYISSENNTKVNYVNQDERDIGSFNDLANIPKNLTIDSSHELAYCMYNDKEITGSYLSSAWYYTTYSVNYTLQIIDETFYVSDTTCTYSFSTNYEELGLAAQIATLQHNVSGSWVTIDTITEPNTLSWVKDITAGNFVNISVTISSIVHYFGYKIADGTFSLTNYTIVENSTHISVAWSGSQTCTCTAWEDNSLKASGDSSSPTEWSKSSIAGDHHVTLLFEATGFDSIVREFTYDVVVTHFSVEVQSFTVSDEYVNIFIVSSKNGNYYIWENNTYTATGAFNGNGTSISHAKNTSNGIYIDLAYKFNDSAGNIVWFNTTYSNSALAALSVNQATVTHDKFNATVQILTNKDDSNFTIWDNGNLQVTQTTAKYYSYKIPGYGNHNVTVKIYWESTTITIKLSYQYIQDEQLMTPQSLTKEYDYVKLGGFKFNYGKDIENIGEAVEPIGDLLGNQGVQAILLLIGILFSIGFVMQKKNTRKTY